MKRTSLIILSSLILFAGGVVGEEIYLKCGKYPLFFKGKFTYFFFIDTDKKSWTMWYEGDGSLDNPAYPDRLPSSPDPMFEGDIKTRVVIVHDFKYELRHKPIKVIPSKYSMTPYYNIDRRTLKLNYRQDGRNDTERTVNCSESDLEAKQSFLAERKRKWEQEKKERKRKWEQEEKERKKEKENELKKRKI